MCLKSLNIVDITTHISNVCMHAAIQKVKISVPMTEHLVALRRSNPIHTSFASVVTKKKVEDKQKNKPDNIQWV